MPTRRIVSRPRRKSGSPSPSAALAGAVPSSAQKTALAGLLLGVGWVLLSGGVARGDSTVRVSVATGGLQSNNFSGSDASALSSDGTIVAFGSIATNLVNPDVNGGTRDIFVRSLSTGITELVSVATDGTQATGISNRPAISGDGRFVVFESLASNLVAGDTNGQRDVFLRDRQLATTTRVSVGSGGSELLGESQGPALSTDGRHIAFSFKGRQQNENDILVRDRLTGTTTTMDVKPLGDEGASFSSRPALSADGRFVAFQSQSQVLVPGVQNQRTHIYVRDRDADVDGIYDEVSEVGAVVTERVSISTGGTLGNKDSRYPSLSADGRWVVFQSEANNLVAGDTCNRIDVFVHDRQLHTTTRLSLADPSTDATDLCGVGGKEDSTRPVISADGRRVIFQSLANDLVIGDTNGVRDIFVRDRDPDEDGIMDEANATTVRVSVDSGGNQATAQSGSTDFRPSISADGLIYAFGSEATNLVPGDTNEARDVFLRLPGACGDGVLTPATGEVCDDGNQTPGDGCEPTCTPTGCGDGSQALDEQCDDGNLSSGDGCDANCTITACGNGVLTDGELCDDDDLVDGNGCDANCTPTSCGNGVQTATEACDDANLVDGDGCDSNCTLTGCGNGVQTDAELCDDGNLVDGDGCDADCTLTTCGNGVQTQDEACDDGNLVNGDGCDATCTPTGCGNGVTTGAEACDDGNLVNDDGCDANCHVTGCGNGLLTAGEACDDGNLVSGDGCDANCTATACGNGIATGAEACDEGTLNGVTGSGCSAQCALVADDSIGLSFYAVTPCRLRDTRAASPVGGTARPMAALESLVLPVTGNACGIPTSARALVLNVVVEGASSLGYLTLYPSSASIPTVSGANFAPGRVRANNAIVKVAANGSGFAAFNGSQGSLELIVDVAGYFE